MRSKYRSKRTLVDGIWFDSKKEAARYCDLRLLERGGVIRGLQWQVSFPIVIDGTKVCVWKADFVYFEGQDRIVEDVKGVRTPIYRLKKKLVEAVYRGVKIREV